MKRTVLAVDIGTSSLKAILADERGNTLAAARCRFPRAKRTANDWTAALKEAVHILKPGPDLAAIAISGNGPTVLGVAPDGKPADILLWNDPVPLAPSAAANGAKAAVKSLFIPRLLAYRNLHPETFVTARWIMSGPEYLAFLLTGNPVTILPEPRYATAYWTIEELNLTGLDGAKLPPFVIAGSVVGKTGNATGDFIPKGIPVVAGGPDFTVALIGTGTLEQGTACDRAGTSEGLNVCTEGIINHADIRPLPAVVEGLWNASYLLPETGADFNAWRRDAGLTTRSYPDLMAEIATSPILPKAGDPLHPGRAVVEEIGFTVRKGIETLAEATGTNPVYRLSGGQARNDIWNRMKADITGATFALTATPDGELMGDAILAFTALGDYGSLREAAAAMVRVVRLYESDPARHALYTEKYLNR
jgi:xylulokinase